MNFGFWNEQPKEWKLGDPSRPSWRTYTLHMIQERSELQRINGDSTLTFLLFLLQHRLPLYFLFYHIPNIRMCTLDNPFLPYQTILIYSPLLLGTIRAAPLSKHSYFTLLATMAIDSTSFTSRNNSENYNTTNDFGANFLCTWTSATRS